MICTLPGFLWKWEKYTIDEAVAQFRREAGKDDEVILLKWRDLFCQRWSLRWFGALVIQIWVSGWWFGTWLLWLSIYWECHNWRTHNFSEGWLNHQPGLVGDKKLNRWCPRPRPNWRPEVVDNVWHSNEGTASRLWWMENGEAATWMRTAPCRSWPRHTKTVNWRWPYPTTASLCDAKNRGRRWVGSVAASCFFDGWVSAELEFN